MELLKQLRKEKGLLQKTVAQHLGVDRTTYVKYENGKSEPDFETLQKLAAFFEVTIDYLITGKEKAAPKTDDGLTEEFVMLYSLLDHETQKVVLAQIKGILNSRE